MQNDAVHISAKAEYAVRALLVLAFSLPLARAAGQSSYSCTARQKAPAARSGSVSDRISISPNCWNSDASSGDGAMGRWSFDENGDTTSRIMSGQTVDNGAFVFVKVLGQ